jgi:hypothetical protein
MRSRRMPRFATLVGRGVLTSVVIGRWLRRELLARKTQLRGVVGSGRIAGRWTCG